VVEQKNNNKNIKNEHELDSWSLYLYAMKSPVTRQKYIGRLNKFFDFLELEGATPEEKSKCFILRSKEKDTRWIFSSILKFMQYQLERPTN
jgi:hypothetical protein